MDGKHRGVQVGLALVLIAAGFCSCASRVSVVDLPAPKDTLAEVGKRLSRKLSAGELTTIAEHGDQVLRALTSIERDALARGYLRFQIDQPADVIVAAPRDSAPFWLRDQGFTATGDVLSDASNSWTLYRKQFPAGWVGLGVNGLDLTPRAHYAVFLVGKGSQPVRVTDLSGTRWEVGTAAVPLALASDLDRRVKQLPPRLRGATVLRTSHDQRHSTRLARGRVWKTHGLSRPEPDQVVVSFGADAASELVWSWRTTPEVEGSVVRLRRKGDPGPFRAYTGASKTITLPEVLNDPTVRRHSVEVAGLEPATMYEYIVGDGTSRVEGFAGEVRTAPRGGQDVCLLYMGDPQCGLEGWGKLLAAARRKRPDAAALLIAGDLVDRGNERTNWDHFFLRAAGVFEGLPLMAACGNHEYLDRGPWLFTSFLDHPANGPEGVQRDLVYSFEVGDAFVAVLDSTLAVSSPSAARVQAEWLDRRLRETTRAWKLVMFHHPIYASHPWREQPQLGEAWGPVFDRHHVDLVLQGHDHAYLRTYPMRGGSRIDSTAEGTVYVVSVSGDKYCDQSPRDYTEFGMTHVSTYQTIDISSRERRLVYQALDLSGRVCDAFTITHPAPTAIEAHANAAGTTTSSYPPREVRRRTLELNPRAQ